jgi:branched-chain amino acid transport system permease protein
MNLVVPILLMSVLGGMNSVVGAIVGTALISVWQQFMRFAESGDLTLAGFQIPIGISDLTLGMALVLILLIRPGGVASDYELGPRPRKTEA